MKISYNLRWCSEDGTAYRQTVRITEEENKALFDGRFNKGINYGNAYTWNFVASRIFNKPEYRKQLKRLIIANTIIFVGGGTIPIC